MIPLTVLPPMRCDSGCGQCCGPVLCKAHEFQAVKKYAAEHGLKPVEQGLTCPWYQGGSCVVYKVRPFVCRMMGHVPTLVCSKGYNVNIAAKLEKRLVKEYGKPTRFLHEILPDGLDRLKASLGSAG